MHHSHVMNQSCMKTSGSKNQFIGNTQGKRTSLQQNKKAVNQAQNEQYSTENCPGFPKRKSMMKQNGSIIIE